MENNHQDELNANDRDTADESGNFGGKAVSNASSDFRRELTEPPKENPFSFKHFLRRDTPSSSTINHSQSNTNIVNGNSSDASASNGTSASPSKSATTSSLNSTGARPKIPQFQSVNVIQQSQADARMKRSPKFSSFDSQSSLSELAEERNMHGSRSNNSFNMDYQFPSSRSYNNYDIEPPSSSPSVKQHGGSRNYAQRSQNNNTSNSILPDFVQDHLLIEYYNHSDSPSTNMSPISGDFSLDNCDALNGPKRGDPFDLPYNRSPSNRRRNNQHSLPLDLPSLDRHHRPVSDLPPDLMDNAASSDVAVQREETYGPHNEPEITRDQAAIDKISQTLPDFLSDGPIHSSGRLADVATVLHEEDNQSIVRLQQENERLRNIIVDMESQISHAKNMETQYNVTLAESMEQVEENLFASNQRATEAIGHANKYKQQVKQLTLEVQNLRRENESLREGGAVGGVGAQRGSSSNRRLARELRMAASSAENNLRQLLSGVENLRLLASAVEKEDQPNASNLDYLSDSDENDFNEGPAL